MKDRFMYWRFLVFNCHYIQTLLFNFVSRKFNNIRPFAVCHEERDTNSTNYISGTYIVCSSSPQFILSIVNKTDNETDPLCVPQRANVGFCDCQNRTFFVEPDGRNADANSRDIKRQRGKGRKNGKTKLKRRSTRTEMRQVASEGRRSTSRDLPFPSSKTGTQRARIRGSSRNGRPSEKLAERPFSFATRVADDTNWIVSRRNIVEDVTAIA